MPESRDRVARPVDIAALFAQRRSQPIGILRDQPQLDLALRSPRQNPAARFGAVGVGAIGGRGRGGFGTPRGQTGRGGRNHLFASPPTGRENTPPIGSAQRVRGRAGRASNSVLPSWYPRTPLRDITAVVRAIERRRERIGASHGQEIGSPMPRADTVADSSEPSPVAHSERSKSIMTPAPTLGVKRCPPKVQKILLDVTNQASGESESLTPQRKLLNSMDTVEKVVMEELRKLKRTPGAKREEREKRVRTLMSMR